MDRKKELRSLCKTECKLYLKVHSVFWEEGLIRLSKDIGRALFTVYKQGYLYRDIKNEEKRFAIKLIGFRRQNAD